jgi:hypothetical protein
LDWDDTTDTDDYDIIRNAATWLDKAAESVYSDENVNRETSYTYQVIANGPLEILFQMKSRKQQNVELEDVLVPSERWMEKEFINTEAPK